MPRFSRNSLTQLNGCHPDLITIFNEIIQSIDCTILEGHRTQEQQEADFTAGRSKLHYPDSKHNSIPAMAADVMLYPIDYSNMPRIYWFAGYVQGIAERLRSEGKISHGVRWGGNWSQTTALEPEKFFDGAHFELI